jgi:histidine triad (HIT) family protein
MSDCVFCEIVAGRVPASIVFRDERCCAFMDIQPVNPGHVLIVPVEHVVSIDDLDEGIGGHLFTVAQRISRALRRSGVHCEGVNLFLADGEAAGQEVFHVHLHLFPRFRNDGFGLRLGPDYGILPTRSDLDEVAEAIRAGL